MDLHEQLAKLEELGFRNRIGGMLFRRVCMRYTDSILLYDGEGGHWVATRGSWRSGLTDGPLAALALAELTDWGGVTLSARDMRQQFKESFTG